MLKANISTFRKIGVFFSRPNSLSCSKCNYSRSCWCREKCCQCHFNPSAVHLKHAPEGTRITGFAPRSKISVLLFFLSQLPSYTWTALLDEPLFFFILFILTVRQPDRKHRSPTRPPSHNKLEVTQLLLHWHQESNACTQHKYIEEWSVSWRGTYPNPDYPV